MKLFAILVLILIAAPAMADHTTQRPIHECVVIRQQGPIWNATPEEVARGIIFPCGLDYNDALRYYNIEVRKREEQVCPRCCCSTGWEKK